VTDPIGVIYLPFQIPTIPDESPHVHLIEHLFKLHKTIVVVLPVRRFPVSANSPLDFRTRQAMINQRYPSIIVLPLPDQKYPENKVKTLEATVYSAFSSRQQAQLYSDITFCLLYIANGGKWVAHDCGYGSSQDSHASQAITYEARQRASIVSDADNETFRRGLIYGLNAQYPISWPTVDIAITRTFERQEQVLLGKKPGEKNWRFPGGFKDRTDNSYEVSALREAEEETYSKDLTAPEYIGSRNVNDWRYTGERDGITTTFFETTFFGNSDQIKAGDDIGEVQWFNVSALSSCMMEGEHSILLELFLDKREWEKRQ
jgi:bifunctional NMN adenylyltransferase/nudix hydrolase